VEVTIDVDPHKSVNAVVAIDEQGELGINPLARFFRESDESRVGSRRAEREVNSQLYTGRAASTSRTLHVGTSIC
jgi:hypothetical protein